VWQARGTNAARDDGSHATFLPKAAATDCRMLIWHTAAVQLHSIGLMCRDCFVFQERALDVGILSIASDCAHWHHHAIVPSLKTPTPLPLSCVFCDGGRFDG
jgi:hypothetical protein